MLELRIAFFVRFVRCFGSGVVRWLLHLWLRALRWIHRAANEREGNQKRVDCNAGEMVKQICCKKLLNGEGERGRLPSRRSPVVVMPLMKSDGN